MDGSITLNFLVVFKKTVCSRILSAKSHQKKFLAIDKVQKNVICVVL